MTTGDPEGPAAADIERRARSVPSDVFLWGAVAALGLSWALRAMGRERDSGLAASWAPTLLILGLYNKLAKLNGSAASEAAYASEI